MKLYTQAKHLSKKSAKELEPNNKQHENDYIVQLFPEKDQPYVSSILNMIDGRKDEIGWNDALELVIDGTTYPNSNLIQLLKFLMKSLIVTREADIPTAAKELLAKLEDIGVPKSWIKVSFPRPKRKRATRSKEDPSEGIPQKVQRGKGIPWLLY